LIDIAVKRWQACKTDHRGHRLRRPKPQAVVEESRVLHRLGLNKLSALEPAEPVRRYERKHLGELIHLDSKSSGGSALWATASLGDIPAQSTVTTASVGEFAHVCIDDASRIAFLQVLDDQRKESAVAFLEAAVAYFAKLNVRIERVMTDNGSCYRSKMFRAACKRFGLRQIFTRPYTTKTNGKAERFIQTALREWAYARAYHSAELLHWLHRSNWHRPHGSLRASTPISRLGLSEDNALGLHRTSSLRRLFRTANLRSW
jgi:transposase InsO family protein